MTTPPVQIPSLAEQAKALLAHAADERHFYEGYVNDNHRTLHERDAATALYAAQAATAHAMLAVVDELAGLRADLRQTAVAPRQDLAQLVGLVHNLATAVATAAAQDADTAGAIRDLHRTLADRMDNQADQVQAVRDEVEDGLANVADTMTLLFDRRRSRWWSRLWWPVRPRSAQARPSVADAAPPNWLSDTLTRAAELLDREGWDPAGVTGRDVMAAVSRATMSSPRSPYDEDLCTHVWDTIVAHLDGQPLAEWQREHGRTQAQVVIMLREVAAQVTVAALSSGARVV
ncbi:DUF6197 family protein [Nonomuraea wenchangensis]|uniref:DUF6197 family protein n=1 Tax=Nonomuraea wenchangensis TaxID=568860 RepID=UPI00331880D7